jgi:hypothetical protein
MEVSDEQMRARYEELSKQGIIAHIVAMCMECRKNAWSGKTVIVKKVSN